MIPNFTITPDLVARYAEMFDIPMTDKELAEMPAQLAGGFAGMARLWEVDVTGCEPAAILPIDRSAAR
jgi:hypothetical protein